MVKVDVTKIKEKATKALQKGKLDKALEAYEELEKATPNDLRIPQKIAEILVRLNQPQKAVEKYRGSAEKYREKGFLVQAIAIYKVILEIVPDDAHAKDELGKLLVERTGVSITPSKPAPAPTPKPAAARAQDLGAPAKPLPKPAPAPAEPSPDEDLAAEPDLEEEVALGSATEEKESPAADSDEEEIETEFETDLDDDLGADVEIEAVPDELDAEPDVDVGVTSLDQEEEMPPVPPERTPLFSDLAPPEFERVFELLESRVIPAGEVIVRDQEPGGSIFIIARGQVRVTKKDDRGKEAKLAVLGPGEFFGEIGYFYGQRRATVTSIRKCLILEISKENLDRVVSEFPRVKDVLQRFYRDRVLDNLMALSPIFSVLGPEERGLLRDRFIFKIFESGQVIVEEGEPGDSMFLIKSGEVLVKTVNPVSNQTMELARLKGGDFFGEVGLIKKKPRTATIVTETDTEVLELTRDDFKDVAEKHPELHAALEKTIEQRVEQTIKKMMEAIEN